jgi:DNA gyrase/topoisomerase IV subunit A
MLGQNTLVESIVDAVKEERIADVSDVRNESGREAQTRIVIELKKGVDPAWSRSSCTSTRPAADLLDPEHRAGESPAADARAA